MNPRADSQGSRARRLGGPRRVLLEVLDLAHDADPGGGRLDAPDRLVARLLVVPPGTRLAPHGERLHALDDRVGPVPVAVEPAGLAVGEGGDAGGLPVADRPWARADQHLVAAPARR